MRFASTSASLGNIGADLPQLLDRAEAQLRGGPVQLGLVFLSSHFEDEAPRVLEHMTRRYPSAVLAGCSAEGVLGHNREHERIPSIAVMLAELPGVHATPFHVSAEELGELDPAQDWGDLLGVPSDSWPNFLFFGDPFTVPLNGVLNAFDRVYPDRPLLGGMASGCEAPGQAAILVGDRVHRDGFGGVALSGRLRVEAVVSQGCRPIGQPLIITRCERNIIHALGGRPAFEQLRETVEELSPRDKKLAGQALFIGRVINEYKETFVRGDFLIRHLMGYDPASGAIMVGDDMRVGATIQFHIRDAASADEDLQQMLAAHRDDNAPEGILLFTCNGRGTRMWTEANHEISTVRNVCGDVPVAGFFAAGEIGPVSGRNFIHGHTASMALFKKASE